MYQVDLRRSRTPTTHLWLNMTYLTNSHSWKFRYVRNLGIQASMTLCRMNREHNKGEAAFTKATLYKMIGDRCAQSFSNVFRERWHEPYGIIDHLYSNHGSENLTQSESCANGWIFFMFKFDPPSRMQYQQYIDLLEMSEVVQLAMLRPHVFSLKEVPSLPKIGSGLVSSEFMAYDSNAFKAYPLSRQPFMRWYSW